MNISAQRNGAKWQSISEVGRDIVSGGDCRSHPEAVWRENVTEFAIRVLNESDARRAVWIVFDSYNFCGDPALASRKINLAIFLFVPAADMPRSEPPVAVATAAFFLRLHKPPLRPPLCDFIESRQRLEAERRR